MPVGSLSSWNAAFATSWMPIALSVPVMVKRPSLNSTSPSDASRRCAASFLPLAIILLLTATMAPPLIVVEREPPGPQPDRAGAVVAGDELDPVRVTPEPVNEHLGLDRGMALAVRDRAGDE